MRRRLKKLMSCLLALAMVLTSLSLPVNTVWVNAASQDAKEQSSSGVNDLVGVKIDHADAVSALQLYLNGVYETKLDLEAGKHTLQVVNNGSNIGEEKTVTLTDKQSVYVRLQDGKVYDSVNDADEFHTAAIVGNFTGLEFLDETGERYDIASWDPADKNAVMDYVGGGLYKKTVTFKKLEKDLTIADKGYKIAFDGNWDKEINDGGNNIALTIPAKTETVTFFADALNGRAYTSVQTSPYEVTQNGGAISYPAFGMIVSLIGTARDNADENWKLEQTGYEFAQISDTLFLYQAEMKKGSYQYKTTFNYEKWYEKTDNKSLSIEEDGTHVVFLYDASDESLYDSVSNGAVIADKLGMKTEPAESSVTNNANGTTKFVTTAGTKETDRVQLVYADKKTPNNTKSITLQKVVSGSGKFNGSFATSDVFFGDQAVDLVYYYDVNGTKVLDSSAETVKVGDTEYSSYTRDAFTGRTVNVPGTFSDPNWVADSNKMTYEGNGIYTYTFKGIIAGNYEFKISMGSWDENYGQEGKAGGANYQVTVPEKQDVTVYYNDITTHYAVTSVDYIIADISLSGTNIPKDSKFTDPGLAGIYTCTIALPAGEYKDVKVSYAGTDYQMDEFTVDKDKDVTFYFDPSTDIYYNDSNATTIDASKVYFDSKDTTYKSVFGAAEEGEKVTYRIQTGADATKVKLIVKGVTNKTVDFTQDKSGENTYWSGDLTMDAYGQYKYFFVVYYGSSVKIYCDDDGNYGSGQLTDLTSLKPYDLTVYKKGYKTPDWMKNAVIYQIFPDRFYDGNVANDDAQTASRGATNYEFISNWGTYPENPEQETLHSSTYPSSAYYGDGIFSNEIYGGDLQGITKRMDYLEAVGVNVIYLNPVFSSISSHRYDTTDYTKIDPILGTLGDFTELVKEAKEHNMHIVLDGVFNHVSDDSVYFDRYYKFVGKDGKVGAYPYWAYVYDYMSENKVEQATAEKKAKEYFAKRGVTDFTYTTWFDIYQTSLLGDDEKPVQDTIGERKGKDVYGYEGWWTYDSMPVIKSTEGSEYKTGNWGETVIEGSDSIGQYWLNEGSNGWRLDVANEVSDETWQHFRDSVKALNSDNVVIGEIWTDASKYLLGDMYDSVMNYVFRDAVLAYAKGGKAEDTIHSLENIRERYPKEAFYAMMNLVASHDTARVLSSLDGIQDDRNDKEDVTKAFPTYETTSDAAKQKQYLVAFMQMTYAGAPTIYYGDEIGMVGADDPDNRRAMTWGEGNKDIVEWYATLAKIRSEYSALRTGDIKAFSINDALLGYVRSDSKDEMIVVMNNTDKDQTITLEAKDYITMKGSTLYDLISKQQYTVENGEVKVTVPAYRGVILTEDQKKITIDTEALKPAYDSEYRVGQNLKKLAFTQTSKKMTLSETLTLTPEVSPKNIADVKASWTSSNEKVATVKNGVVTPVAEGIATITVTYGQKSAACKVEVAGLGAVAGVKASSTSKNSVTLQWNATKGATGYEVYRMNGKRWSKVGEVTKTTFTEKNLSSATAYTYRVRAYRLQNAGLSYGAYSSPITVKTAVDNTPAKVTGVKVKAKSTTQVKLYWTQVKNASGYDIYMKENNGSYKKIKTITKGSYVTYKVGGLKEGNRYKFRICAFKKVSKQVTYGKWSDTVAIRMEVSAPSKLYADQKSKTKAKISWRKVNGVSGYEVTMSTNNGKYKKVATVKKGSDTSVKVYNLKRGKTYRFQIRAYKVVDGKKYYSKTTTSKKLKMR